MPTWSTFFQHPWRVGLLTVLGFGLLVFGHGTVWDDHWLQNDARVLQGLSWEGLRALVSSDYWAGTGVEGRVSYWRPLLTLSFQVEHTLHGGQARGMHLLNVLLHGLNGVALGAVIRALLLRLETPRRRAGWLGTLCTVLFLIHPLTVESWAWISGRTDLLAMTFGLAALRLTDRLTQEAEQQKAWGWAAGVGVLLLLGLLSKEVAWVFGALSLMWPGKTSRHTRLLVPPVLLTFAGYGVARLWVLGLPQTAGGAFDLGAALVRAGVSLGHYATMLVWPFNPSALPATKVLVPHLLGLGLLLGGLSAALFWQKRQAPGPRLALLWVGGGLLPVLNLIPLDAPSPVAERFWYVPLGGVLAGLACGVRSLVVPAPLARVQPVLLLSCVLALGGVSVARALEWHSDRTLWEAEADRHGLRHLLTARNLGVARRDEGDLHGALDCWLQALARPNGLPQDERPLMGVLAAQTLIETGAGAQAISLIDTLLTQGPPPDLGGKLLALRAQAVVLPSRKD